MPYLICDKCDVYYKFNKLAEMEKYSKCECGNLLKYYNSLEEYIYQESEYQAVKHKDKTSNKFQELINEYESTIGKIILYCTNELPFPIGIKSTISVLKGSKSPLIVDHKLYKLNTYAIFSDFPREKLNKAIDALINNEMLEIKMVSQYKNMPTLFLTEKGENFLESKKTANLEISFHQKDKILPEFDEKLFNKLRSLRNNIAKNKNVPAYIICNNATLMELAQKMPINRQSMLSVRGIGKRFIENYGYQFIQAIREYIEKGI